MRCSWGWRSQQAGTPVLDRCWAAALTLAGTSGQLGVGVSLLAVYALGLGVPFVLSAVMLTSFSRFSRRFRPYLPWVERVSGAVLVVAGVMLLTGTYTALNGTLIRYTPDWLWSPFVTRVAETYKAQIAEAQSTPTTPAVELSGLARALRSGVCTQKCQLERVAGSDAGAARGATRGQNHPFAGPLDAAQAKPWRGPRVGFRSGQRGAQRPRAGCVLERVRRCLRRADGP